MRNSVTKAIDYILAETKLTVTAQTHKTVTFGTKKQSKVYQISDAGWVRLSRTGWGWNLINPRKECKEWPDPAKRIHVRCDPIRSAVIIVRHVGRHHPSLVCGLNLNVPYKLTFMGR